MRQLDEAWGGALRAPPWDLPHASVLGKPLLFHLLLLGKAAAPCGTREQVKVCSGMGRVGSLTTAGRRGN